MPPWPRGARPSTLSTQHDGETVQPPMDREAALVRLGGDAELLEELLALMLVQSRELAAEIREAVPRANIKVVLIAAHTIRGSAANLEIGALADAAFVLEAMARRNDLSTADEICARIEAELDRLEEFAAG